MAAYKSNIRWVMNAFVEWNAIQHIISGRYKYKLSDINYKASHIPQC